MSEMASLDGVAVAEEDPCLPVNEKEGEQATRSTPDSKRAIAEKKHINLAGECLTDDNIRGTNI